MTGRVVVAGEALVDLVIGVDGAVTAALGGGPFNVARTIARLGGDVAFLGTLSDDRFGARLRARLVDDGVSPDAIVSTTNPTTLAAAELDAGGAATYRFYLDGTSAPALQAVPALGTAPSAVHVGTLGLVLEPMATTLTRFVLDLPDDVLVMVDPNCRARVIADRDAYLRRLAQVHRRAHVVKISTDDAEYLDPRASPVAVARRLVDDGVRAVLLTGGSEAAWAITSTGETAVPTMPTTVVDTIGAGDSFGGAFLTWWLAQGMGIDDLASHDVVVAAVTAAQQVAAITCARAGAEPPWRHELPDTWGRRSG